MDNFSAESPSLLKASEPLAGPTVSAWSVPPPMPVGSVLPPSPSQAPLPLWTFGLLLVAQVGFSVIFAYLVFALGQRVDRADAVTNTALAKVAHLQEVIRTQQLIDKELVARIPGMLDRVASMQHDSTMHAAALKIFEPQAQAMRQEIQQLRREHDLLVGHVRGLPFGRTPSLPLRSRKP